MHREPHSIEKTGWLRAAVLGANMSHDALGGVAAKAGGAPLLPAVVRVTFWSALAMGLSSAVGAIFSTLAN